MDTTAIVEVIDSEIRRLQEARALLTGTTTEHSPAAKQVQRKRRRLSAAARAKIAAAQRARWAKQKKKQ